MEHTRQVKKILWLILLANVLVAVTKLFLGQLIASASLTADGWHSFTDGTSNIVALVGLAFAARPVDEDHPYGHCKFEMLTSLFIGGLLLVMAWRIFEEAWQRWQQPVAPQFGWEVLTVLLLTLIINLGICAYEMRKGRELSSYLLTADALHTKSDIFVTLGVLATLLALKLGAPPAVDSLASVLVGCFILYAGWEIIRDTGSILADKAALDHSAVEEIVRSFAGVLDVHRIRSRGVQPSVFLDMHIKLDSCMPLGKAHGLAHDLEEEIKRQLGEYINITIHMEPYRQEPYRK